MNKIKNAVIIHGPGRSGTTLLSNMLSLHREFYWISGYLNKFPHLPILTLANNLQFLKYFEEFSRAKKKFPRPAEAYNFWTYYFPDFNTIDGTPKIDEVQSALKTLHKMDQFSMGHRFITKLTGYSRFNYLESLFENPTVLWIDRNPESVVMSFYKQKWGYKSKPEQFKTTPKLK